TKAPYEDHCVHCRRRADVLWKLYPRQRVGGGDQEPGPRYQPGAHLYPDTDRRAERQRAQSILRRHQRVSGAALCPVPLDSLAARPAVGFPVGTQACLAALNRSKPTPLGRTDCFHAARRAGNSQLTQEATVSMLRGEQGFQRKEIRKLTSWLRSEAPPDIVTLPNSLLIGLARPIREAVGRPICCTLQG